MRILAIDPFHGAAGDMILGALISLGADRERVLGVMASIVATPAAEIVSRAGIMACKIHTCAGPAARTLDDVLERVRSADAPPDVIIRAEAVFHRIARGEESVHGKTDHFHEVGADDAIADVIGSCMALHLLSPDRVEILPLATGTGTIHMAHGCYPVPGPATAAILSGSRLEVIIGGGQGELCTPTGAALLAEFCTDPVRSVTAGRIVNIGYGAGDRDDPDVPNVIRMMMVESGTIMTGDIVDILETNVDDVSGEVIGHLLTRLMEAGARDASAAPLLMKKGRPGHLIRVICRPADSQMISVLMARELGTLGIRCIPSVHRFIADRRVEEVEVTIDGKSGIFPVKAGYIDGSCYLIKAEYDAVCRFSGNHNLPARLVTRIVEEAAWKKIRHGQDCLK